MDTQVILWFLSFWWVLSWMVLVAGRLNEAGFPSWWIKPTSTPWHSLLPCTCTGSLHGHFVGSLPNSRKRDIWQPEKLMKTIHWQGALKDRDLFLRYNKSIVLPWGCYLERKLNCLISFGTVLLLSLLPYMHVQTLSTHNHTNTHIYYNIFLLHSPPATTIQSATGLGDINSL